MNNLNEKYVVRPSRLAGQVCLSGAKNSALRLLVAALLTEEEVQLENYPSDIIDAQVQVEMLRMVGKECVVHDNRIVISEPATVQSDVHWKGESIRNTLLMLGALVARTGKGAVPLPGGCKLGERKYDIHEMILRRMGAEVWTEGDMLLAQAERPLKGTDLHLPIRSTGATENAIICGSLAEGTTRVWNPHTRPEIMDLIEALRKMGSRIEVYGQEHICIHGATSLHGCRHMVVSDNMEAITWLIASVITGGDVEILGFPFEHLEIPLIQLRESGAKFFRGGESLIVRGGRCYPIDISTGPYPGINSDMQPLFAVYALCATGESRIIDLRFPGRYRYAEEMSRMGGRFKTEGNMLHIYGGVPLIGSTVTATDIRAGAALTLAGVVADGETVIEDAWQIRRGYNHFRQKLNSLGGNCELASSFE